MKPYGAREGRPPAATRPPRPPHGQRLTRRPKQFTTPPEKKMSIIIEHDGDTWRILSEGRTDGDKTFCHLASTTRFRVQKNGKNPIQMCDWIENNRILSSAMQAEELMRNDYITAYYDDRNNSGLSTLEAHR
jgi:hypothetical protein